MDKTLENLKNNPGFNCDILEILRRQTGRVLYAENGDFLIYDTASGGNYMNASTIEAARHMLDLVTDGNLFCIRQKEYSAIIEKKFPVKYRLKVSQAYYAENTPITLPEIPFEIKRLDHTHIPFLKENYKEVQTQGYIEGRVSEGMFGIFDENRIAGFIGKHEEGSMGLLHIMPSHRRMNLGVALLAFMVNRTLELGEYPYSQVSLGNDASLSLHKKLGFRISGEYVYWLDRESL